MGWLELAGEILLWWNPLYWFVRRRLRESAEGVDATASFQIGRTQTTLVRTSYNLPKAKAEALTLFLKENVDFDLEVTAGDDGLTVTADPEASAAIGRLISLMTRKKIAPSTRPAADERVPY